MEYLDIVIVPLIVAIVYGCIELLKKAVGNNEKVLRFIPLIAATLGAVFGVIAFYAAPEIIPASNVLLALLIGGSSGLAATGTHQVFKQLIFLFRQHKFLITIEGAVAGKVKFDITNLENIPDFCFR